MAAEYDTWKRLTCLVGDFPPGMVALVGAGPGDSALISVRGAVRLMQADVVLHDRLVGPELLELPAPDAERIFVGKYRGRHVWTQAQINTELVRFAQAGRRVVRLKGGDPFVLGRGGEECLALAEAGIPYEVVPGITAAFGAPASAGIPLTHRGLSRSFVLATAHAEPGDSDAPDFGALARMGTVVLYMAVANLERTTAALIEAGVATGTPAAVIEWGTRPQQRVVEGTVGDLADRVSAEKVRPPAMVVIGQVVSLRRSLAWFERRPLYGRTVVVTRRQEQASDLGGMLRAAGARVICAPTIEMAPVADYGPVDASLRKVADYDWLVVTSANGVDTLFARLAMLDRDSRHLAGVRIAAVGSATAAALAEHGIRADLIPGEAVGEALADALIAQDVRDKRVLLLRAEKARAIVPHALTEAGADVDDVAVYKTCAPGHLPEAFLDELRAGHVDWVTLMSPSALENLLQLLGPERAAWLEPVKWASIGPVTSKALREAGFRVHAEAEPHDASGLVRALVAAEQRPPASDGDA